MLLITKDRTENSGGLRIPAAEIEQLVSSRMHRWLLDPGSIYKSTSARLADASTQQRLVARAAEIGKHWPELPVARKRAVLTGLIERVEVCWRGSSCARCPGQMFRRKSELPGGGTMDAPRIRR